MRTIWLPLSALPYFYLYGRDLKLSGYSWIDLPRVYALNLMLVPVNLGGVLKSIQQAVTKEKIPFVRTPKIGNRTAAPALYLLATVMIFAYCFVMGLFDIVESRWMHATFAFMNGLFFAYVCTSFIGWREGYEDVKASWFAPKGQENGAISQIGRRVSLSTHLKKWPSRVHIGFRKTQSRLSNPVPVPKQDQADDKVSL